MAAPVTTPHQPPFIVFSLPRSRSAWLSRFLTYGDWQCGHEEARHVRSQEDVVSWLKQPATGTVETAAAPFWRTLLKVCPGVRIVTIRRPPADVVDSLLRTGAVTDREAALRAMRAMDAKLDQIERRIPGVLSVPYEALATEEGCRLVFEFCLPYQHDPAWWAAWAGVNIQINLGHLFRHYQAHKAQMDRVAAQLRCMTLADLARKPARVPDDLKVDVDPFATLYADSERLRAQHFAAIGEHPYAGPPKNFPLLQALDDLGVLRCFTARCNGRLVGYLITVLNPSLEDPAVREATHTAFYADPVFTGAGRALQRAAKDHLGAEGVDTLFTRAGVRGDGPRMAALYQRLGAEDLGRMFKLNLKETL